MARPPTVCVNYSVNICIKFTSILCSLGGNGGRGGDVFLECSHSVWDFSGLQHHVVCFTKNRFINLGNEVKEKCVTPHLLFHSECQARRAWNF
jgi:hypothetical protein